MCRTCERIGHECTTCKAEREGKLRPANGVIVPKDEREARKRETASQERES